MVVCQTKLQPSRLLGKPQHPLSMRLLSGDQQGKVYCLNEAKSLLGSGSTCAVQVTADGVRPAHCLIVQGAHQTIVRRWAAEAWLNGQAFETAHLNTGDHLQVGSVEFEVLSEPADLEGFVNHKEETSKLNRLELSTLKEEFRESVLHNSKLEAEILMLQSAIEESRSRVEFLSEEETVAKVESLSHQARIQELQRLLAKQDSLLKTKQAKWQQALENETTRFQEEKQVYNLDLSKRLTNITKLEEECQEHRKSLTSLQTLQQEQHNKVAQLQNALQTAEMQLQEQDESSEASSTNWEEKQAAWTEVRKRLEAERGAMKEQHEIAAAAWNVTSAEANEKHDALKHEMSQIEEELVTVSLQLTETTNAEHRKASEIAKIETTLENTRNELQESKNRLESAQTDWTEQEATWTKVRERLEEERATHKNRFDEETQTWQTKETAFKKEVSGLERNVKHVEEELVAICNQLTHAVEDGRRQSEQKEAFESELKVVSETLQTNQNRLEAAQEEWEEKQVAWTEVRKRWEAERAELLEQHANEIQAWEEKEIAAEKNASLQQETVSWLEDEISRVKQSLEIAEKATLQETNHVAELQTLVSESEEALCKEQEALKQANEAVEVKEMQWTEFRQKWEAERVQSSAEHDASLQQIEEQLALKQRIVEEKTAAITSLQEELRHVQEDAAHSELSIAEQVEQFGKLQENFSNNELELQNIRETWLQAQASAETKAIEWQQEQSAKEDELVRLQKSLENEQTSYENEVNQLKQQLEEITEEKERLETCAAENEEAYQRLEDESKKTKEHESSELQEKAAEELKALEASHQHALAESQEKLKGLQEELNQKLEEHKKTEDALHERLEEEKVILETERESLKASLEIALQERDTARQDQSQVTETESVDSANYENEEAYALLSKELEEREQQLADRETNFAKEQHAFQELLEQHSELSEDVALEEQQEELVEDRLDSMVEQLKNSQLDEDNSLPSPEEERGTDNSDTEAAIEHLKALNIWDESVQEESVQQPASDEGMFAEPEPQKSWLPDSLEEESASVLDASQENSFTETEDSNNDAPLEPIETVNEIHETPENGETEDEAALTEYMSKLMQRVRGEPELASPVVATPTLPVAPVSVEEPKNEAACTLKTSNISEVAVVEPEPKATEEHVPFSWDETKPKLSLPERQGNYESLRNLANSSARTALGRHAKTMSYKLFFSKVFVSVVGLIAGGLLLFLSDTWVSIEASAGFASLAVGGIWAMQSCGLLLEAIRRGSFSVGETTQTQTDTEPVPESAVS